MALKPTKPQLRALFLAVRHGGEVTIGSCVDPPLRMDLLERCRAAGWLGRWRDASSPGGCRRYAYPITANGRAIVAEHDAADVEEPEIPDWAPRG
jgi:hypothetical protein